MTTTTIWRARCSDCGLEQRRKSEPRRRTDAHNDLFCHDCVHPIEWQRWEVSEERGWKVGERTTRGTIVWVGWRGHLVTGEPGSLHRTRKAADEEAKYRRVGNPYEVVIQRVTRRTLKNQPLDAPDAQPTAAHLGDDGADLVRLTAARATCALEPAQHRAPAEGDGVPKRLWWWG